MHAHSILLLLLSTLLHRTHASLSIHPPLYDVLPSHHTHTWLNNLKYINPWNSYHPTSFLQIATYALQKVIKRRPVDTETLDVQVVPARWIGNTTREETRVTWLGHAANYIQINGVNIITDPVFEQRCSPSQKFGLPKRFTQPPAKVDELPRPDIIILSHNHYDHLCHKTLKKFEKYNPHFIVPLGVRADLPSHYDVTEMDWWQSVKFQGLTITATPAQHNSGRGLFDRGSSLWASFAIVQDGLNGKRIWFGGDTGFRYVPKGANPDDMPHCPAFKEIGDRLGPFDLSLIPIGAYNPRHLFSPVHADPQDAVEIHRLVRSKKSFGIHWGVFILTTEPVNEPPRLLRKYAERAGLRDDEFVTIDIGESVAV